MSERAAARERRQWTGRARGKEPPHSTGTHEVFQGIAEAAEHGAAHLRVPSGINARAQERREEHRPPARSTQLDVGDLGHGNCSAVPRLVARRVERDQELASAGSGARLAFTRISGVAPRILTSFLMASFVGTGMSVQRFHRRMRAVSFWRTGKSACTAAVPHPKGHVQAHLRVQRVLDEDARKLAVVVRLRAVLCRDCQARKVHGLQKTRSNARIPDMADCTPM